MSRSMKFIELIIRVKVFHMYYRIGHYHLMESKKYLFDNKQNELWRRHFLKTLKYFEKCDKQQAKIEELKKYL